MQWFSEPLAVIHEPALWCGQQTADETYRFIWIRSFHSPVVVRVSRSGSSYHLHAEMRSTMASVSAPARSVDRKIKAGDWHKLGYALAWASFRQQPTTVIDTGEDGAEWIFEGSSPNYHIVARWSPQRGSRVWGLGLTFLKLAGFDDERPLY